MNAISPVGASAPYDSAAKHVSGRAVYIDDMPEPPGLLHVFFGLSPHARARIRSIGLSAVAATPGVAAVKTANDVPGVNDVGPAFMGDPIFADGLVKYHGQSIVDTIDEALTAQIFAVPGELG